MFDHVLHETINFMMWVISIVDNLLTPIYNIPHLHTITPYIQTMHTIHHLHSITPYTQTINTIPHTKFTIYKPITPYWQSKWQFCTWPIIT